MTPHWLTEPFDRMDLWWLLLFVPIVAILFFWEVRRSRRMLRSIVDANLREALMGQMPGWRRGLRRVFFVTALFFLVLACLRPRWGFKSDRAQHIGIDIAILLDVSRSMLVSDVPPNRLKAAITDISGFLDRLHGGRVSLVPFAGVAFVQCPPTRDHEVIRQYLADLKVQDLPVAGTNVGEALHIGLDSLGVTGGRVEGNEVVHRYTGSKYKALILFTDGEDMTTGIDDALGRVKEAGIPVFTVGVGTPAGKPVPGLTEDGEVSGIQRDEDGKPVFSALNEALLERLARETGANRYSLANGSVVRSLYADIDRLEKKEFEDRTRELREDHYGLPLIIALLLLLLEPWIPEEPRSRRRRFEHRGATRKMREATKVSLLVSLFIVITTITGQGCAYDEEPFVIESAEVADALQAVKDGRAGEAVTMLGEALEDLGDHPELHLDLGVAHLAHRDFSQAITELKRALERIPTKHRIRVLYGLGLAEARQALALEVAVKKAPPSDEPVDGQPTVEDKQVQALEAWIRARDRFEECLGIEAGHEGARLGLEMALYRTDPPCRFRDHDGEPDDPPEAPRALEIGEPDYQTKLESLLCSDDVDQYGLSLKTGTRLFVNLKASDGEGEPLLKVTGFPVADAPKLNTIQGLVMSKDRSGVLAIHHEDPLAAEMSYELSVQAIPACSLLDPENSRDDTLGSARRVTSLQEAPFRLCPGDQDHFATEVLDGYSLLVLVDINPKQQQQDGGGAEKTGGPVLPDQPQQIAPDVQIFDLNGRLRARGMSGGGRSFAVLPTPPADGYVVRIAAPAAHPDLETPYRISIVPVPPCPEGNLDDFVAQSQGRPVNDLVDDAVELQPESVGLGRICSGDTDWYAIQANEEKETQVEVLYDRNKALLTLDGYPGDDVQGDGLQVTETPMGAMMRVPKAEEAEAPKVRVQGAEEGAEGFYLIRHVAGQGGQGGQKKEDQNESDSGDGPESEDQEQQDRQQDQSQGNAEQEKRTLDQLLREMDQNPRNLEAEEALRARKALGKLAKPMKDW